MLFKDVPLEGNGCLKIVHVFVLLLSAAFFAGYVKARQYDPNTDVRIRRTWTGQELYAGDVASYTRAAEKEANVCLTLAVSGIVFVFATARRN
jgi:hypothetical protein